MRSPGVLSILMSREIDKIGLLKQLIRMRACCAQFGFSDDFYYGER